MGFCDKGYNTFCKVCNGISPNVNDRYVPAAIQNYTKGKKRNLYGKNVCDKI